MSLVAREAITPTNQSPIYLIVTWVLQAAVLLAVGVKVLLLYTSIGIHVDDWSILIAAVFSIGQVIAASVQGVNGIGKVQSTLSQTQLVTYQKAGYASEILFILTLLASKLSVLIFLYQITPFKRWHRVTIGVGLFVILWSLSSLFVVAFQCDNPDEWKFVEGQCIDQVAFWTTYSCFNIITELALIAVPAEMFYLLIRSTHKKLILISCFSLRICVVVVIALQLYYLHHSVYPSTSSAISTDDSDDFTFSTWPVFLTTQIVQCLSIITTCVPFMRNLFLGLETGMIQTGHVSGRHFSMAVPSRSTEHSSTSSGRLSGWRWNSADATASTLVGSARHSSNVTATTLRSSARHSSNATATTLGSSARHSSGATTSAASRQMSEASTLVTSARTSRTPVLNLLGSGALEVVQTPRSLIFNRRSSGATTEGARTPITPTFNQRGSSGPIPPSPLSPIRPGIEYTYSRRHFSMIVEDEDEEDEAHQHHAHEIGTVSEHEAEQLLLESAEQVDGEMQRPRFVLDVNIPSARLSFGSWRNSWRSSWSGSSSGQKRASRGSRTSWSLRDDEENGLRSSTQFRALGDIAGHI